MQKLWPNMQLVLSRPKQAAARVRLVADWLRRLCTIIIHILSMMLFPIMHTT